MSKSLWLVCTKVELRTASKGTSLKLKAVSVCNLQFVNGFLKGLRCLASTFLRDCCWTVRLLLLSTVCPCVIYCQGHPE